MDSISTAALLGILFFLIILSALFSSSETALMSLNRYRLRHHARLGSVAAKRVQTLLKRPDRLIGLILLGNNFVNILASSIATIIALREWGEAGIAIAAGLLTLFILIFAEVAPKTLAALHPEAIAFPAARVYIHLLKLLYPIVWLVNSISNALLGLFGVDIEKTNTAINREELRSIVLDTSCTLPPQHRDMLLSILDLGASTVDDIMIPRNEITGIDLNQDRQHTIDQLQNAPYTRLPAYKGHIDNITGIIHTRKALQTLLTQQDENINLTAFIQKPRYVPEKTSLSQQLTNFQKQRVRISFVVNEYGDVLGLVTLEDILEEIIGDFTTDPSDAIPTIRQIEDDIFLVEGSATLHELSKAIDWDIADKRANTLSGIIVEQLQSLPQTGTSVMLANRPVEILRIKGSIVRLARVGALQTTNQK